MTTTTTRKRPGPFSLKRIHEPVQARYGDISLLICSYVTGLVDSMVFLNYGVFVGMQTGNTIILGLSASNSVPSQPYAYLTTLTAIGCFLFGAAVTTHLARRFKAPGTSPPTHLTRGKVTALFLAQCIFLILGAALLTTNLIPTLDNLPSTSQPTTLEEKHTALSSTPKIAGALPALAFQSGIQIATSRVLGFAEIPVNVVTSAMADLVGDPLLFAARNDKRNRRVAAAVLTLAGAISNGWMARGGVKAEVVLWISAGLKGVATFWVWFVLRREEGEEV